MDQTLKINKLILEPMSLLRLAYINLNFFSYLLCDQISNLFLMFFGSYHACTDFIRKDDQESISFPCT